MPYGRITQLGECHLDKVKVAGSSPVLPTIARNWISFFKRRSGFFFYTDIFIILMVIEL